ncbi:hypothetical protein [Gynuella sp.]|uniref:hypothetical protein n=1 Tax=Gynuella sp. TaxID=2969146 RepID=UPI003D0D2406
MADSILAVAHGMGQHTTESLRTLIEKAANTALQRYPTFRNRNFENYVDIKPIVYDDIFEQERQRIVQSNRPVSDYFKSATNLPSLFIENIVELEADVGDDNFYTTQALDVLLYASLHGESVRLRILSEICTHMATKGSASFHVIGHSLSTSAIIDTLHKAYTGGITDQNGHSFKLDTITHKLDSLWMFANVSRLMHRLNPIRTSPDPKDTVVKPGTGTDSCTLHYYNIHHELDPFTRFLHFDPQPNEAWIHPDDYESYYHKLITHNIGESLDPHDLTGYLTDPLVSYRFLKRVMPAGSFNPSRDEVMKAHASVRNLADESKKIATYVNSIGSVSDFKTFLKMVKEYQEYITSLKSSMKP